MTIITIILLSFVIFALFITCPLNIEYIIIDSLPVYLSVRKALKLFERTNNKENRKYILTICSDGKYFTNDFCKYCKVNNCLIDTSTLGFIIYEYVQFKEHIVKNKELENNYD